MGFLVNILLVVVTVAGMEAFAYYTHKYVMHGFMWTWHQSHHEPREGNFEKNDLFAVVFSVPSIILIYLGVNFYGPLLYIGIGIALYGLIYFVFHDVIVHQRIRMPIPRGNEYLKRIIQAHRIHHAVHTKEGTVSFGFLYAPRVELLKAELKEMGASGSY